MGTTFRCCYPKRGLCIEEETFGPRLPVRDNQFSTSDVGPMFDAQSQPPWLTQCYTNPKLSFNIALRKAIVSISEQINSRNVCQCHGIGRDSLFLFNNRSLHADLPGVVASHPAGRADCIWELFWPFSQKKRIILSAETVFLLERVFGRT